MIGSSGETTGCKHIARKFTCTLLTHLCLGTRSFNIALRGLRRSFGATRGVISITSFCAGTIEYYSRIVGSGSCSVRSSFFTGFGVRGRGDERGVFIVIRSKGTRFSVHCGNSVSGGLHVVALALACPVGAA